jgi:hypothetical protein
MPLNDIEKKRIEYALYKFLAKRRPPSHIRKDLDIGNRLSGQSIELLKSGRNGTTHRSSISVRLPKRPTSEPKIAGKCSGCGQC